MNPRLLGALTLLADAAFVSALALILTATVAGGGEPQMSGATEGIVRAALILGAVLVALIVPVYLNDVRNRDELKKHQRKRWLFALGLYGPFSMPVYWWRYLQRRDGDGDGE